MSDSAFRLSTVAAPCSHAREHWPQARGPAPSPAAAAKGAALGPSPSAEVDPPGRAAAPPIAEADELEQRIRAAAFVSRRARVIVAPSERADAIEISHALARELGRRVEIVVSRERTRVVEPEPEPAPRPAPPPTRSPSPPARPRRREAEAADVDEALRHRRVAAVTAMRAAPQGGEVAPDGDLVAWAAEAAAVLGLRVTVVAEAAAPGAQGAA